MPPNSVRACSKDCAKISRRLPGGCTGVPPPLASCSASIASARACIRAIFSCCLAESWTGLRSRIRIRLRIARRYPVRPGAGKSLAGRVMVGSVIDHVITARMRGEPIGPQHVDVVAPIFADPRVAATMGGVQSREQVLEILEHQVAAWERDGFGYWMFFESS